MKQLIKVLLVSGMFLTLTTFSSCGEAEEPEKQGQIMFWVNSNVGTVEVSVNNVVKGTITKYFSSNNPTTCDTDGCVTVKLKEGFYSYKATTKSGKTWEATEKWEADQCKSILLVP